MMEIHDRIGALIDAARAARKLAADQAREKNGAAIAARQPFPGNAMEVSGGPWQNAPKTTS